MRWINKKFYGNADNITIALWADASGREGDLGTLVGKCSLHGVWVDKPAGCKTEKEIETFNDYLSHSFVMQPSKHNNSPPYHARIIEYVGMSKSIQDYYVDNINGDIGVTIQLDDTDNPKINYDGT